MPRKHNYFGGILGASPLVPDPIFDITFTAKGAGGGGHQSGGWARSGGAGGLAEATFSSADFGSSLKIVVGSGGTHYGYTGLGSVSNRRLKGMTNTSTAYNNTTTQAINIAAASMTLQNNTVRYGLGGSHGYVGGSGGGGGFTGVFSGTTIQQSDAMLIAAGGGGAGYSANGGAGGGTTGANGSGTNAGGGGSQTAGGAAGYGGSQNLTWSPGYSQGLLGGSAFGGDHGGGGGGGGGYYGGGAGWNGDTPTGNAGAGGGSSFIHSSGTSTTNTQGGGSAAGSGNNDGTDGNLVITLPTGKTLALSNTTGTISAGTPSTTATHKTYTISGAGVAEVTIT
ncbi:MAG: hypothetical protein ACPG1A_09020 [Halioglobus sp.]